MSEAFESMTGEQDELEVGWSWRGDQLGIEAQRGGERLWLSAGALAQMLPDKLKGTELHAALMRQD